MLILLLFIVVIGSFTFSPQAQACDCADPGGPAEELERAKAVFSGKLLFSKIERQQEGMRGAIEYWNVYLFEVQETWKGVGQTQFIVYDTTSNCGAFYQEGATYLVYAYEHKEKGLYTSSCHRTMELSHAQEDLYVLGAGQTDLEEVNLRGKMRWITDKDYDLFIVGSGFIITVMLLLSLIRKLRRRP